MEVLVLSFWWAFFQTRQTPIQRVHRQRLCRWSWGHFAVDFGRRRANSLQCFAGGGPRYCCEARRFPNRNWNWRTVIAEGTTELPVIFTSKLDDTYGAGGTFDTNNNGTTNTPAPRNWGGIYASPGSNVSLDHSQVSYAGGITRLDGTFRAFNALEIQQATARVANTLFSFNEDGVGGQGPSTRFGRLENESAVIFVRGSSPIFLNNTFLNNVSVANDNGFPDPIRSIELPLSQSMQTR